MHGSFEPANLAEEGRSLYQKGQYLAAAENFHAARVGFELKGDRYTAAEMANNCSVSYLLAKSASEALEELNGIEEYYSEIGDSMRQGITAGNAACALDALDRVDEAQSGYMRSAALLEKTGEDQFRANVMQSLSALQLRSGRKLEALVSMQQGIDGLKRPSLVQKMAKSILQYPFKMLNKGH